MAKFLEIDDGGFVWHVPVVNIADNRANYYASKDEDTTYQEEFDYLMTDNSEVIDWYANNMDFEDVEDFARLVSTPEHKTKPGNDATLKVREK